MSHLSELLMRAVTHFERLSPVDKALMEAQQKRSWVIGETGRDPGLGVLAEEVLRLRKELEWQRGGKLDGKEAERLQRLRDYAYQLQNRLDNKPARFDMGHTKARLSAVCWAIEKITGEFFSPATEERK